MGNASDELKEQIRELARKQLQKAKKVGERAYDAAQQEADAKKPDRGPALINPRHFQPASCVMNSPIGQVAAQLNYGIHLPAQSATDSVPAGRANRQAGADTQCRRLSFVGWSLRICFSFNAGQWVARPMCPAAQAANFGLLDLQLTEADRRPFKLPPAQLGELPIEPAEERLSSLRVASIAALRRRSSSSNRE
jgi:hypothetical protein